MSKIDINTFKKELKTCFEENIIENDPLLSSVDIEKEIVNNKGHGITILAEKDGVPMGVIIYIEPLIKSYQMGVSMLDICTGIAAQVNEIIAVHYQTAADVLEKEVVYDRHNPDNICSVMQTIHVPEYLRKGNHVMRDLDIGLTQIIKTKIKTTESNQRLYIPPVNHYADINELDFDIAVSRTALYAEMTVYQHDDTKYSIFDKQNFADYFYLVNTEFLKAFTSQQSIERLYIQPKSAYAADCFAIPKNCSEEQKELITKQIQAVIYKYYLASGSDNNENAALPMYVYSNEENKVSIVAISLSEK